MAALVIIIKYLLFEIFITMIYAVNSKDILPIISFKLNLLNKNDWDNYQITKQYDYYDKYNEYTPRLIKQKHDINTLTIRYKLKGESNKCISIFLSISHKLCVVK